MTFENFFVFWAFIGFEKIDKNRSRKHYEENDLLDTICVDFSTCYSAIPNRGRIERDFAKNVP